MSNEKKISQQIKQFHELDNRLMSVEHKLDEFILLLENSNLDTDSIKNIQGKINTALEKELVRDKAVNEIKSISLLEIDNLEKLDKLEIFLNNNYFDSRKNHKERIGQGTIKLIRVIIGFLMVTLGFAMIILPAPRYFEMFTIFHFTYNDGFTLMDLISLIVVATGIYIIIKSYFKFNL